jgi:hypothetical protein
MVIRLFHESDVRWMVVRGVSETTDHRRKFLSVFRSVLPGLMCAVATVKFRLGVELALA